MAGVVSAGIGSLSRCNAMKNFKDLLRKHGYIEEAEAYCEKGIESRIHHEYPGRRRTTGKRQGGRWLEIPDHAAPLSRVVGEVQMRCGFSDSSGAAEFDGRFLSRRGIWAAA
jgi:hypothetical protein